MLSKHAGRCRYPHGHTRRIEVVVSAESLDSNEMVMDFKALKLAVADHIERYDHAMAVNSNDPLLPEMKRVHPGSVIEFQDQDPTTEIMAKELYDYVSKVLANGWSGTAKDGVPYRIEPGSVHLDRIRVWETPTSWAEYGD